MKVLKFSKTKNILSRLKQHIDKYDKLTLDLSELHIIDAAHILALVCAKYPDNKLNCVVPSEDITSFVPDAFLKNLTFVL